MAESSAPVSRRREWIGQIEHIITELLRRLRDKLPDPVRIPEVIKLIELHTKLGGDDADTSAFWNFIEDIRQGRVTCEGAPGDADSSSTETEEASHDEMADADSAPDRG